MLDMLALHNTSAARTGFQEPFGYFFVGGSGGRGILEPTFAIFYILLHALTTLLQHLTTWFVLCLFGLEIATSIYIIHWFKDDWAFQNGVDFFAENNEQILKNVNP